MSNTKNEVIVLRVDHDLKTILQKLADEDSRKLSDYIRVELKRLVEAKKK